jgi:hypothetical protein
MSYIVDKHASRDQCLRCPLSATGAERQSSVKCKCGRQAPESLQDPDLECEAPATHTPVPYPPRSQLRRDGSREERGRYDQVGVKSSKVSGRQDLELGFGFGSVVS